MNKIKFNIQFAFFIGLLCLSFSNRAQNEPGDSISQKYELDTTQVEDMEAKVDEFIETDKAIYREGGERGLMHFVGMNLKYPMPALHEGVEGEILLSFVVEPDGSVADISVVGDRKLGFGCEEAAIEVLKQTSGKWIPAQINSQPVKMRYNLPLTFEIQDENSSSKKKRRN